MAAYNEQVQQRANARDVPAVRMEEVCKRYGHFTALAEIGLDVARGGSCNPAW